MPSSLSISIIKISNKLKNIRPENNLYIFSDPRGGSTWLMEMLTNIPKTAIIWEPFHLKKGIFPEHLKLGWRPYIPEFSENKEYKNIFKKILSGHFQNDWTTKSCSFKEYIYADKLIFKFVRINSLLPWITKNFNFDYKPIYLLRHPIPTALSQIKAFDKDIIFDGFKIPDVLYNEKYREHSDFLAQLRTPLENKVAIWCLHNMHSINHERNSKDWITVYYEDLLLYPERELKRIFEIWGIPIPVEIMENIRKASSTDFENDFIADPEKQLSKWENEIKNEELYRLQALLDYFQIKDYSVDHVMPIKSIYLNTIIRLISRTGNNPL